MENSNISKNKYFLLGLVILAVIASIIYLESTKNKFDIPNQTININKKSGYIQAPELAGISGYINTNNSATNPLKISNLRGKVVLIDFWTYSCINCIRTLPHLVAWNEKYSNKGLVIIGVHTPEFAFEKDYNNVFAATNKYGIKFPVVLDNNYATWKNYKNQYWPRKYLIDKDGNIRYDHIGEGGYEETEKQIQELLLESSEKVTGMVNVEDTTPDTSNSPETYLGWQFALPRNENIGNAGGFQKNIDYNYSMPEKILDDKAYLEGEWISNPEYLTPVNTDANDSKSSSSNIYFQFTAKNANIVLSGNGTVDVFIDGKIIPKNMQGVDVIDGKIIVNASQLYSVYEGAYETHLLKLAFKDSINAHAFTFG